MSITIYYLSATGNSLHAAKKLAEKLSLSETNVSLYSIPDIIKETAITPKGSIGLVMPLHFFGLPILVEEFLSKLDLSKTDYVFTVITCGFHYISNAFHELKQIVANRHGKLHAAFYVDMISIYLPLNDLPSRSKILKKLSSADDKLDSIAEKISSHQTASAHEYFNLISKIIHNRYNNHPEKLDEQFTLSGNCSNCGLCAKVCPRSNIIIETGSPKWLHSCTQCLACLHICPEKSIELGTRTKDRKRYHHPDIELKELFSKRFV
ncbi:EFR1 family ferrodoxin [Pectinatus frisingensis]|uniref:EFR1 family ferrodoxin n=1 Tax=Pectinatus frisingensis TaxID=865 RepID=UPI0018C62522|nr:EFR1 family ferrodoxin [Pectinatus frisingensis]